MNVQKTCLSMAALLGLGLITVGAANAQEPAGAAPQRGQGRGQGGRQGMMNQVGPAFKSVMPTADQQKKFDELEAKFQTDMMALRQNAGGDRQAMMQKFQELNQKFRTDAAALLTDEQKPKFEEALRRGGNRGLMDQLGDLNLTEEQKGKIKPIADATQEEIQKTMRDQNAEPQARREKMTQAVDDFKAKIRPLLNADQQKKLDTLRLQMGRGGQRRRQGNANPPANL